LFFSSSEDDEEEEESLLFPPKGEGEGSLGAGGGMLRLALFGSSI